MNLADQRVEAVGYERPEAGRGGQAITPGNTGFAATKRRIGPYALAVVFIASAVALGVLDQLLGSDQLAFPLMLMGIAAAVWYAGPAPGALAIVLACLFFDFFFTDPLYTFEIHASDRPYFVAFVLFALLIGWFASRRRRVERELRVARDELAVEVVKRTEQASLLDLTHDTIFVRGMDDVISYWNHGCAGAVRMDVRTGDREIRARAAPDGLPDAARADPRGADPHRALGGRAREDEI